MLSERQRSRKWSRPRLETTAKTASLLQLEQEETRAATADAVPRRLPLASLLSPRPRTTPADVLSGGAALRPEQHWQLNAAATSSLTSKQLEQLYALFRFYDSSARGDTLPAVHSSRLLELFRDAELLATESTDDGGELKPATVERIFAQAAMGTMRTYLDADERPALTFPSFCGALLHAAAIKFPQQSSRPGAAFGMLLAKLMAMMDMQPRADDLPRHGLIQHLPSSGPTAQWTTAEAIKTELEPDYRINGPFPDVLASFRSDEADAARRALRSAKAYLVPPELAAQFSAPALAALVNSFRTFDVLDTGALPRHELFALLSSLAKTLEITDVTAVIAQLVGISGSRQLPSASGIKPKETPADISLLQLIETLAARRAARSASHNARKAPAQVPTAAAVTATPATANSAENDGPSDNAKAQASAAPSSGKERHRKSKPARRSNAHASSSISQLGGEDHIGSAPHPTGKKLKHGHSVAHHRTAAKSISDPEGVAVPRASVRPLRLDSTARPVEDTSSTSGQSTCTGTSRSSSKTPEAAHHRTEQDTSQVVERSLDAPLPRVVVSKPAHSLEVELLQGGDHDGAIVCTLTLHLATRELVEHRGELVAGRACAQSLAPALPTQPSVAAALLLLKKRVSVQLADGFVPRSAAQVEAVDELIKASQAREPRYFSPLDKSVISRSTGALKAEPTSPKAISRHPKSPTRAMEAAARSQPLIEELKRVEDEQRAAVEAARDWVRALNVASSPNARVR